MFYAVAELTDQNVEPQLKGNFSIWNTSWFSE